MITGNGYTCLTPPWTVHIGQLNGYPADYASGPAAPP